MVEIDRVALETFILKFCKRVFTFCTFRNYFSLEIGVAFHLNKPEFPSRKGTLFQGYFKLPRSSLEFFFSFRQCIFLFLYLSLKKDVAYQLNRIEIPCTQKCSVPILVKLTQWFKRKNENAKS